MSVTITPTENDLEDLLCEATLAANGAGFATLRDIGDYQAEAAEGMMKFGSGFTRPLGMALANADAFNTPKLIHAFRDICDKHRDLYLQYVKNRGEVGVL